ncbi:hypothetical protein ASZ90_015833 [hydrocarbon metagenome]|uniref:Uncharacterized protein n=1 Tax=hydrocarbon metagenome TaxID=938273 RepID=A0A0W8F0W1_9ZZZZ
MPAEEIVSMINEKCIRIIRIVPGRKVSREKCGTRMCTGGGCR